MVVACRLIILNVCYFARCDIFKTSCIVIDIFTCLDTYSVNSYAKAVSIPAYWLTPSFPLFVSLAFFASVSYLLA